MVIDGSVGPSDDGLCAHLFRFLIFFVCFSLVHFFFLFELIFLGLVLYWTVRRIGLIVACKRD